MVPSSMAEDASGSSVTSQVTSVMRPMPVSADQQVETVDQTQLMSILTNIQKTLEATPATAPVEGAMPART